MLIMTIKGGWKDSMDQQPLKISKRDTKVTKMTGKSKLYRP